MSYLFAAFSVVWAAFFLYSWYLLKRVSRVERELQNLGELLEERER